MQWLPWADAAGLAVAAAVAAPVMAAAGRRRERIPGDVDRPPGAGYGGETERSKGSRWAAPAAWTKELAVMLALYGLWQLAGDLSLGGQAGAIGRGRAIYQFERSAGLPSEASVQHLFLGAHWLLRLFNLYYVGLHVALMGACLVWVFARHRDRYPLVRNTLALSTAACLLVALVPVAPPRLVPGLGLVDTGRLFGPTVYPATDQPGVDQLSAMPSVHVAWALIVAFAVVVALRSRWRWAAFAYPVFTLTVVVVTGNHYWADGAVAAVIVAVSAAVCTWADRSLRRSAVARSLSRRRPASPGRDRPSPPGPVSRPDSSPSSPAPV